MALRVPLLHGEDAWQQQVRCQNWSRFVPPSFDNNNKTELSIVYLFVPWLQEFQQLLPSKSGKRVTSLRLTAHLAFGGMRTFKT